MKKQPQVTEQTKANLRDAFWQLYTQKPLDKISVREITDLAGYNRGTFYLYYRDVYDIFSQIEDELLEKIQTALNASIQQNDTFDPLAHMDIFLDLMQTHFKYASVLLSDHGDPYFTSRLKEILLPFFNRYFLPAGELSAYERELLTEFYATGFITAVIRWISDPQIPLDEFIFFIISKVFGDSYT